MRLTLLAGFGYNIEQAIAGTAIYTDITQYVEIKGGGVSITHGAADELADIQSSTMSVSLDNRDGRFTPTNTAGAYYPNIKKSVPVIARVTSLGAGNSPNLCNASVDFEGDTTGWISSGTPVITNSAAFAQFGTQSMLITWGGVAGQAALMANNYRLYGLTIGQQYTASGYVRVPTGDQAVRLVAFHGETLGTSVAGTANTVFDAFQRITVTFTATSTRAAIDIQPSATPTAGDIVYVDGFQVEAGASPTTFNANNSKIHVRFVGMINEWPVQWNGLHSTVSVVCSDLMKLLSRKTLRPMLNEEILKDGPIVYYPLGEPEESVTSGNESDTLGPSVLQIGQAGTGGTLTFGTGGGPADSLPAPTFTRAGSNDGKYLYGTLGPAFEAGQAAQAISIEGWFATSNQTQRQTIMTLRDSSSFSEIEFYLQTTGEFSISATDSNGNQNGATITGAGDLVDGSTHHFIYRELDDVVYIDGVSYGAFPALPSTTSLNEIYLGAYYSPGSGGTLFSDFSSLYTGTIAQVALYTNAVSGAEIATHYTTGKTNHSGELSWQRCDRLAGYTGNGVKPQGSTFDGVSEQRALGKTALEHIREIEITDFGRFFQERESHTHVFQSRDLRLNAVSAFSLSYSDLETNDIDLADDDQKLLNYLVATRPGGAIQKIQDQTSIDNFGVYQQELTLYRLTDESVIDSANYLISSYSDPKPEFRKLPVQAWTMTSPTYRQLLDADISTAFDVTNLPSQAPSSTIRAMVEGYTEILRHNSHMIEFNASQSSDFQVWVLDSSEYSVLDSTTRLGF